MRTPRPRPAGLPRGTPAHAAAAPASSAGVPPSGAVSGRRCAPGRSLRAGPPSMSQRTGHGRGPPSSGGTRPPGPGLRVLRAGKGLPRHLDQRGERRGVADGQLREHPPVHIHAGGLQALDKPVVRHAVHAGCGVDALDPQPPEGALAVLAVPVGVGHRVENLLLGLAVHARPLAPVSARPLKDDPALLVGAHRPLHACHNFDSSVTRAGGYLPSSFLISLTSLPASGTSPLSRRVRRDGLCSSRWLRLARRRITLPEPVSLKRFPAPLCVFIFGMVAVVSIHVRAAGAAILRSSYVFQARRSLRRPPPAALIRWPAVISGRCDGTRRHSHGAAGSALGAVRSARVSVRARAARPAWPPRRAWRRPAPRHARHWGPARAARARVPLPAAGPLPAA